MITKDFTLEIQTLLLQSLITGKDMFVRCQNILKPEYFDTELQGTIKFIMKYADEFNAIPASEQIQANCGTKLEKLNEFNDQHQKYYLEQIEAFCRHKALVGAILSSADLIEKNNTAGIEQLIKDAILISLERNLGTDYFENPRERLLRLKEQNGNMSTGWPSVDRKLYNVSRGEVLLFLGLPGAGKSMVMQNVTLNVALNGLNVVYLTLEMSEELCAKRMDSMVSGITPSEIYRNLDEVEIKVKSMGHRTGSITLKGFPASTISARDIRAYLKEYEIQKGYVPDVLVVDYLDIMLPNDKKISHSDFFVKDKFIIEELRNLAKEYKLLAVTSGQINRSGTDTTEFDISHVAGGRSKIDTADNVIAIRSGIVLRDKGEMQFEFLKTRNSGGVGSKVIMHLDLETLRLTDIDADEDAKVKPRSSTSIMNQIKARTNSAVVVDKVVEEIKKEEEDLPWDVSVPVKETPIVQPSKPIDQVAHTSSLRDLINKTKKK